MKIALAADFHLDYRQFNSQQRWHDYIDTFAKVTRKVAELKPDAYVIAGDLFERYMPHPGVIRRFLKEVSILDCPIILIRGNHDSPQIFFDKFGGDILHLLQDVSEIVYLNPEKPCYEIGDLCFIGIGYSGFNATKEIEGCVKGVKSAAKTRIGVFHQLLDYPGVPEKQIEVSRSFLKGLGFDYVLMGHWHVRYEEKGLYSPGSSEYWAFDQGEQVNLNLDTYAEKVTPTKDKGFYLVDTAKGSGDFTHVEPARPMYSITYETKSFDEAKHLPIIKKHMEKYNLEGALVETKVKGKCRYGRITLGKELALDKPLIHSFSTNLKPSDAAEEKVDTMAAEATYLAERGVGKNVSKRIAEWLEHNRDDLSSMQARELLISLRSILQSDSDRKAPTASV